MQSTARWYKPLNDGRLLCTLCPRGCKLHEGDRGFCFVRKNDGGAMVLETYGKSTGFCVDPIEKKPLNHFLPGTPVLSFGTAGCNLGCKFCQNWDISKSREVARLSNLASPEAIVQAALEHNCRSVAFTYNDPVIWAEYALDTARACHEVGLNSVAVTAGYMMPEARREFYDHMDAANIDLKAFSEEFYYRITSSHLAPVLETIQYVCNETKCWVELTNLVIPKANDDASELQRMCDWILESIGPNVPIHFTAFHPDFRMTDRERTPHAKLVEAYDIARSAGLNYVYVGNVHDVQRQSTYCHSCQALLIQRDWYELGAYHFRGSQCPKCGTTIPGVFDTKPGDWGRKRLPIVIRTIPTESQPTMPTTNLESPELKLSSIHRAASLFVMAAVNRSSDQPGIEALGALIDDPAHGVYVTLKRGDTLRGCCGWTGGERPLGVGLADAAFRTAKQDPRMPPIAPDELPYLQLSVSLLGPCEPIDCVRQDPDDCIKIGTHGIRMRHREKSGLLLPSVAVEHHMNAGQFLDALCRKSGLPAGAWLDPACSVERFEGHVITKPIDIDVPPQNITSVCTQEEVQSLKLWVFQNLIALRSNATPFYYASGITDQDVLGVGIQVVDGEGSTPCAVFKLYLLHSMPMQASLFELTQQLAKQSPGTIPPDTVHVAVFRSAIDHGTVENCDLRGVDSKARAMLVSDGRTWSLRFDPKMEPQDNLGQAIKRERFRDKTAHVYSLQCVSSHPWFVASTSPQPISTISARQPAVAGTFYPSSDADRTAMVEQALRPYREANRERVSAIMVPHAGLRFSGSVAAAVWSCIEIPDQVIIVGPKHTNEGVDWAAAPHNRWHLSANASQPGETELAAEIAKHLPGCQLDAAAHVREHGIEMQLPFLNQLAPQARVTALAIHGGSLRELREAAKAMASLLKQLPKLPLLVISSDMNHFANDQENQRRDRLALDAMKSLNPEQLFEVCESNQISMCGLRPAVLVMFALQELGLPMTYREVAYATSAAVTGDPSRVVGYAGVLL